MEKDKIEKHSFRANLVFKIKTSILKFLRCFRDIKNRLPKLQKTEKNFSHCIARSVSSLWDQNQPQEYRLTLGKVHNLRVALTKLHKIEIPEGEIFSFWRQLGRLTRFKGYTFGRELREGCLVPSVGGGICQLSNALYDVALQAGFEIIERHAHTKVLPNSLASRGLDATVFWNYVDLRFRANTSCQLSFKMDAKNLYVEIWANQKKDVSFLCDVSKKQVDDVKGCDTCENTECSQYLNLNLEKKSLKTAYVLDEFWSEYDDYFKNQIQKEDLVLLPIDGLRWKKANYKWSIHNQNFKTASLQTILWAFKLRKLKNQGRERQLTLLKRDQNLAKKLSKKIPFDATHLVVMQKFLLGLEKTGAFFGRTYDVLMVRLPLKILQEKLNEAKTLWPQSKTLDDFRIDQNALDKEWSLLLRAKTIITPHSEIAKNFPEKTILLPWQDCQKNQKQKSDYIKSKIIFPAATVGRKGAYLVRDLVKKLNLELVILGSVIEDDDFWKGLSVQKKNFSEEWWLDAKTVILPAVIENKPRALLKAKSFGIPVLASAGCGLEDVENVKTIDSYDLMVWQKELEALL